jgi:hypothetical protein
MVLEATQRDYRYLDRMDRPLGDTTTLIDLADRDEMDNQLFPLDAEKSWFSRTASRRVLPFTPILQEFITKGTLDFGGKFVFEVDSKACDLLFSVGLQIKLGHWLPSDILVRLQSGTFSYNDPSLAWFYANSLGSVLIQRADLIVEEQIVETVDGDFSNIFSKVYEDSNTNFGLANDAYGSVGIVDLKGWNPKRVFPTNNGYITCILPFSFQRVRLKNGFPLLSCKGKVRIEVTLRPFSECVRIANGVRVGCNETPLGKKFNISGQSVFASAVEPAFLDARLVTYGVLTDGKLREALIKAPYERLFREIQKFSFSEPKRYLVNAGGGIVRLQLPLEVNGPLEEIIWVIRRKAVALNNEWTNYSNTLESEYDVVNRPFKSMLKYGALQVNGIPLIEADGDYFRRNIAKNHKSGIVAYNSFIYGYTFALEPGSHNPSGWINTSRTTDVRLRLDIVPPNGSEDLEFEVLVYCICMNWLRFENGLVNKLFSS